MPRAILFGGVNGAGKTTFARGLLALGAPGAAFLNADEIQRELGPEASPVTARRILLERLADHLAHQRSDAIESTLASTS